MRELVAQYFSVFVCCVALHAIYLPKFRDGDDVFQIGIYVHCLLNERRGTSNRILVLWRGRNWNNSEI